MMRNPILQKLLSVYSCWDLGGVVVTLESGIQDLLPHLPYGATLLELLGR